MSILNFIESHYSKHTCKPVYARRLFLVSYRYIKDSRINSRYASSKTQNANQNEEDDLLNVLYSQAIRLSTFSRELAQYACLSS